MKSLQKQVGFGQKKAVKKVVNKEENLIHCFETLSYGGVVSFADLISWQFK